MTRVTLASPNQSLSRGDDEPFSSPLFREVMERFDPARRHVILETGSTSPGTLALLQGNRCRLLVADAALALSELNDKAEEAEAEVAESLLQQAQGFIPDSGGERIDTVLCWDLLNYLSLPLLQVLCGRLSALMSPQGMLHGYIHTAQSTMPRRPQRYSVLGEDQVVRLDRDADERKTPRYSYGDLDKYAMGMQVARSVLLRNGIQEYLLRMHPSLGE